MANDPIFGYETRHQPLLGLRAFARRLFSNFGVAVVFIAMSLAGGMIGYRYLERPPMPWIDAFESAAMILAGMGPTEPSPKTWAGKLFAGCYALYSALALIIVAAIIITPVAHRFLHRFHLESEQDE